jgi:molybdate transport system ATP-binding protein
LNGAPGGSEPRLQRIELRHVGVRYGRRWAVRGLDFELRSGERWLLLGGNGAGKTVLMKLLRGDLWPTPERGASRRFFMSRGEVHEQPLYARDRIAYLGPERQDRYDRHESTLDVAQVVQTGFDDSGFPLTLPTARERSRIAAVLGQVGLAGLAPRRFLSLSYGQRRRVLLARALVRRPDVLLLDEALNGLDVASRREFLRVLAHAVPARTALVLSSHRPADAPLGLTHVARLEAGRLLECLPVVVPARDPPAGGRAGSRLPSMRPARASRSVPRPLLRLTRAAVYREGRLVIGAFDWGLQPRDHWHVTGRNGSGKSTLMALLYGDLWPAHGGELERNPATCATAAVWKRGIGLISPELQSTYAATACTVEEIVVSGLHASIGLDSPPTARELALARRELRAWRIAHLAGCSARQLSYGQLRLALAARAFVRPRRLLLFDEPFDGLDAHAVRQLRERVDAAVRRGATLVLATHHADDVPGYVCNMLQMRAGRAPEVTRNDARD